MVNETHFRMSVFPLPGKNTTPTLSMGLLDGANLYPMPRDFYLMTEADTSFGTLCFLTRNKKMEEGQLSQGNFHKE